MFAVEMQFAKLSTVLEPQACLMQVLGHLEVQF